ncbi:MAG TPA: bifunctional hydroxymethylpyrimidine kinase/phosphomethylpyrimidine kinase [Alphaproteobacteria bacterium]|nr:bifunctional hydroxymethylpyrimidine kinase/phosphomethylpyrimidine kinase [Alphaproteobacteria bacterium]
MKSVLTIAGFDGSCGAGLQADLKTFAALGCYGTTVMTALTIQNTLGVFGCYDMPLKSIKEQLQVIFDDIKPDAIKIGMLFNNEIIHEVAQFLKPYYKDIPIVLDPVMVAKSGDNLLLKDAIEALKFELIPLTSILTPNIPEACSLLGFKAIDKTTMEEAAKILLSLGPKAVLLKGGHLGSSYATDLFIGSDKEFEYFSQPRIESKNTHGTGCTLSSSIASFLALGQSPLMACKKAKDYLHGAITRGAVDSVGKGHGPVHHFYKWW